MGLLSQGAAELDIARVLTRMIQLRGFTLRPHSVAEKAAVVARFRQRWLPELVAGRIAPEIHAVLPFRDAAEAHRILETADNFGKIILRM